MTIRQKIGVIGARGFVGAELLRLIAAHPKLQLSYASSRQFEGKKIEESTAQSYVNLSPNDAAGRGADLVFLALPNTLAAPWVEVITRHKPDTRFIDMSADYRFDDHWVYGLPEHNRAALQDARLIANPGCYATAAQIAIAPVKNLLSAPPVIFGVSGYSGAGTTPGPRNDPAKLKDNLMPYGLGGHIHEREISRQLGRQVDFMPHVAAFFRGLSVTVNMRFSTVTTEAELRNFYEAAYANEALVQIIDDAPQVRDITGQYGAKVGGFALSADGKRAVMVCVLDNLLKGAASQAIQNLNLALGVDEYLGLGNVEK